ncbi:MAG: phosphoribosyltransferase [Candidatus Acidiferrum sp.]
MIFKNREDAGRKLAARLGKYANRDDVTVLGVPRGGIPVAFEVAMALKLPLDVFVLRKLGVPGHEELAFGAIGSGGVRVLNPSVVQQLGISDAEIALVTGAEKQELERREVLYRGKRPPLDLHRRTVILVDDGIATGASLTAGIHALKQMHPAAIVVAAPVAPPETCARLRREVDEVVCVEMPEPFYGVGRFYDDFSQVPDEEVNELLDRAWRNIVEQEYHNAAVEPRGSRR